jgi:hypothetical protein
MMLFPAFALGLLTLSLVRAGGSLRLGVARAGVVMLLLTELGSEALSAFAALKPAPLAAFWAGAAGAAGIWAWRTKAAAGLLRRLRHATPRAWPYGLVMLVGVLTLTVACLAPPNTWDGMTYHMSRVVHWLENGSLNYFHTAITRQNAMPPLGEETILHLQALSGSDRWANIPAWFYFCGSLLLVHLLSKATGVAPATTALCTALAALLPMALFQATSCKNDAITAFLCLFFCHALLRLSRRWCLSEAAWAGASLGLGLYCKGTVLLIAGSCGLAFAWLFWMRPPQGLSRGRVLALAGFGLAIAAALSAPHALRDRLQGRVGAEPPWSATIGNQERGPAAIVANLARDASLHLTLPHDGWNKMLYAGLAAFLGSELNNPNTTFERNPFATFYAQHEDYAGNPWHFLLASVAVASLLPALSRRRPAIRLLVISVLLGVLAFATALKWQPWQSRLHTPLFWLAVPLVGLSVERICRQPRLRWLPAGVLHGGILGVALLGAATALVANPSRPLLALNGVSVLRTERVALYFVNRPELLADYANLDRILRNSTLNGTSIGILCGEDDWEYPLYVFSGAAEQNPAYRFHHCDLRQAEQIVLGLGDKGRSLEGNGSARVVYKGPYLTLYTAQR